MAYEVTATRRRPKTFDELAGQDFVTATLKNSMETGHIAHAYLFAGPRGCGKTSAARILARSLNCEKGPSAVPCGVCSNCVEISRGASMDVIEIDGASNTSVNDVRQIKDEVLFPPHSGRYKVYIIDEVHMLSNSAFNALLKTIEEPPPYIIFIFATTELHKVPATIKSRCQQFNFRLIPIETIQKILRDTCGEMNIEAEEEALFWIAKESTGSLRDAYTLFDQVASFSGGHIRSALIREKLGLVGLDQLNALAEACAAHDTAAAFTLIDGILEAGVAIEQLVIDLAEYYHSLLLIKAGITRESLLGYGPERFSAKVADSLDGLRLEHALELLLGLYRDIRYSLSARFELETVISKLIWLDQWIAPPELREALAQARGALQGGIGRPLAVPEPQKAPADSGIREETPPFPRPPGGASGGGDRPAGMPLGRSSGAGSLSEEFKRYIAARESGTVPPEDYGAFAKTAVPAGGGEPASEGEALPESGAGEEIDFSEDPFRQPPEHPVPKEPAGEELSPQAELVLRIFRGTVVKNEHGVGHEY
ncbi:MAG: DNA polymerase III subunit gamma/tau [Treponema sp.]|jgi:DNA polymerase-3 subunit gamma/tau|nr:DNA polymerase III subunit gamma/tau [Treponema sp.]